MSTTLKQRSRRQILTAIGAASTLVLGACGSSPAVRYYTLQVPANERAAEPLAGVAAASRSVQLVSVTVPEVVDRPQLVLRTGDNTLNVNEQARWAEPLKKSLAGALASEMMQVLGGAPVVLRVSGIEDAAWKLSVDIQRLDAQVGKGVVLEAVWSLRDKAGTKTISRHSVIKELVMGDALETIVAAESRAVAKLAGEIALLINEQADARR